MTRSEEELRVGTRQREAGRARLRKYVVTESVTTTVPVQREEVRVEREPITDANRDEAMSGAHISEEEHEVVLHEEEPVVEKRVVPKERVRLDKETVGEQLHQGLSAEQAGSYLRDADADSMLSDAEDFGRRKPGAVAAGALALGSSRRHRHVRWRAGHHVPRAPTPDRLCDRAAGHRDGRVDRRADHHRRLRRRCGRSRPHRQEAGIGSDTPCTRANRRHP